MSAGNEHGRVGAPLATIRTARCSRRSRQARHACGRPHPHLLRQARGVVVSA
ncbi:hypothetical protein [Actinomyces bovis]|uniref:hypothetical protein n=1 Tax=Actinomyces bovis TaxID=1658 RepID=UPI0014738D90|nr:hypothetical protein [Actinomyces bovis]